MFKHHLLISFRNLKRHKASLFINLAGLSTGLACVFLIFLWVKDELNFDKFHEKDEQLFQVLQISKENDQVVIHEHTQGPLAAAMAKDLPEVEFAVPVMSLEKENQRFILKVGDKTVRKDGIFAGKDFFHAFSFPLIHGNPNQSLADKNSIVISEDLANFFFNSPADAMGKSIEWEVSGKKLVSMVTGVTKTAPVNSSLKFDVILTHEMLLTELWTNGQNWWNEGVQTYVVLKKGTDIAQFNNKIKKFVNNYYEKNSFTSFVRSYSGAYLHGNYENGVQSGGRIEYVNLFSIVAIFILVIACVNFMNLSTAKASRRQKEVGIKKAVGSSRKALILQFLSESVIMAFLSAILAAVIVVLFLPEFNRITGKQLTIDLNPGMIITIIGVTLLTGLLAGSYPAFYLSGFNPIAVLKGKIKKSLPELMVRKGLVVFQFMVSLVLIISVIVVYKQMAYIRSKNLGYNRDNIILFDKEGTLSQNTSSFLAGLKNIPGVVNASSIQENVVSEGGGSSTYGINWPGKTDKDRIDFVVRAVDYNMIEMLDIKMKEGRSFSEKFGAEKTKIIFNETAVRLMRLKDPLGAKIKMWGMDMEIVGVVKDFHIGSLHEAILPMLFMYEPENTYMIMARIDGTKQAETLAAINAYYKKYNPGYTFDFKFLDNTYQAQYVSENRVSALSKYFAGLAILISCLGLFGLAAFNAEVRTKEIGIRKVLGASVGHVIALLSMDFLKLVIIAITIAFPLAWWAMNNWLNGFVYKTNIGAGVFLVALGSIVFITIITVGFQAVKAAVANPVKSLRTE